MAPEQHHYTTLEQVQAVHRSGRQAGSRSVIAASLSVSSKLCQLLKHSFLYALSEQYGTGYGSTIFKLTTTELFLLELTI